MTTSFPRLIARAAFFVALVIPTANLYAQQKFSLGSSERSTSNEVEKAEPYILKVIDKAETHFKQGKLNLGDNKRYEARDEFDKAVNVILDSGLDVRGNPRLQTYYLELVERIYRLEVPQQTTAAPRMEVAQNMQNPTATAQYQEDKNEQESGFKQQKFEPSPLDELSKLVLTPAEQVVDPEDVATIEVVKNAIDFPFETNSMIQQFINYYQGRGRSTMESGLRRSGQFMTMARKIFREEGVPEDITWLGQVESAWRPTVCSWASACGLWQFIPGTGRTYGLRQTAWVDERNSFEKATRASARYLRDLYNHFRDWELAMAAYNTGQGNIDRAISRAGSRSFWKIYPYIAQETRNYVPNILATMLIAKDPTRYGFRNVRPDAPLTYDVVQVPTATNLQLVAQATSVSKDYIRMLNPELRRDVTPRGEAYNLRIPAGRANQFVAALKGVPVERRDAPPSNGLKEVIYTPRAGSTPTPGLMMVRARSGDTPSRLATLHNVSAEEIAKLNGVAINSEFEVGKEVRVPKPAPTSSRRRSSR